MEPLLYYIAVVEKIAYCGVKKLVSRYSAKAPATTCHELLDFLGAKTRVLALEGSASLRR